MFYHHSVCVGTCLWDGSDQPLCQLETQSWCSWLPFWVCVWEMFRIHLSLTEHQCWVQPAVHIEVMEQVHSQLQHDMHILLRIATEYCVSIRILLALPAVLLIKAKNEGGRTSLECDKLIEHVNRHQVSCWIMFSILFWYNFFIILVCLSALILFVSELLFSKNEWCSHLISFFFSLCNRGTSVLLLVCCPALSQHTSWKWEALSSFKDKMHYHMLSNSCWWEIRRVSLFVLPFQGVLCASVRCAHPAEEVNKALSQISLCCPLLLVSTVVTFASHCR